MGLVANGTVCVAASGCMGGVESRGAQCNGVGNCVTLPSDPCFPYPCDAGGVLCAATCDDNSGCIPPFTCDAATSTCLVSNDGPAGSAGSSASGSDDGSFFTIGNFRIPNPLQLGTWSFYALAAITLLLLLVCCSAVYRSVCNKRRQARVHPSMLDDHEWRG